MKVPQILLICALVAASGRKSATGDPEPPPTPVGAFDAQQDVGDAHKGRAEFDVVSREYRITGSGANMWFKTDSFHFLYKKISGDVAITADVRFVGRGKEPHRKAALIVRQSLAPDSQYADVVVHGDGTTSLQYRPGPGVDTEEAPTGVTAPNSIRIERHGHEFMVAAGNPGKATQMAGPIIVTMKDPVYVGLAVCSHSPDVLETAIFSDVKVEQGRRR